MYQEALPLVRCTKELLWQSVAVVRDSAFFAKAVLDEVAEDRVDNAYQGPKRPRGGVTYQIARTLSELCCDHTSAVTAAGIIAYAHAQAHPLQFLTSEDRLRFHAFFVELRAYSEDAQWYHHGQLCTKESSERANLDALFFTPEAYVYLLWNTQAYNLRDHFHSVSSLATHPDGQELVDSRGTSVAVESDAAASHS